MFPPQEFNELRRQEAEARIRDAIDTLKAAGQPVTVRAIRRQAGGSFSTICRVLKEIQYERLAELEFRPGESTHAFLLRCIEILGK